ncbi:MAG: transcriptional regulator [Candidatus Gracilibacteria bacterium]|nr:transcriptional regulator [Candidatus Gracilibacteria bacterium]
MFDPLIHQPIRSKLIAQLIANEELPFKYLKDNLELTDGNLSSHLSKLETANYIQIEKSFDNKRPKTTIKITEEGRVAFENYIAQLKLFIENSSI